MELFGPGNGVVSNIEIGYKMVRSCSMYSIDEIKRGCERANTLDGFKLELCSATDTRFSETEICTVSGYGPETDSGNFGNTDPRKYFCESKKSKIDFHRMIR